MISGITRPRRIEESKSSGSWNTEEAKHNLRMTTNLDAIKIGTQQSWERVSDSIFMNEMHFKWNPQIERWDLATRNYKNMDNSN